MVDIYSWWCNMLLCQRFNWCSTSNDRKMKICSRGKETYIMYNINHEPTVFYRMVLEITSHDIPRQGLACTTALTGWESSLAMENAEQREIFLPTANSPYGVCLKTSWVPGEPSSFSTDGHTGNGSKTSKTSKYPYLHWFIADFHKPSRGVSWKWGDPQSSPWPFMTWGISGDILAYPD